MSNPGLFTNITQVTLFGVDVTLTDPQNPGQAPIQNYVGDPLFVTKWAVEGGVLVVTIDDQGPPAPPPGPFSATGAQALLSYAGQGPFRSNTTSVTPAYDGGAYTLSGTLVPDPTILAQVDLKPAVSQWVAPSGDLSYVLVQPGGGAMEIRWLSPDVRISPVPQTSHIVPPATGGSSLGPFGIETP